MSKRGQSPTDRKLSLGGASLGKLQEVAHGSDELAASIFRIADFYCCLRSNLWLQWLHIHTKDSPPKNAIRLTELRQALHCRNNIGAVSPFWPILAL